MLAWLRKGAVSSDGKASYYTIVLDRKCGSAGCNARWGVKAWSPDPLTTLPCNLEGGARWELGKSAAMELWLPTCTQSVLLNSPRTHVLESLSSLLTPS